MSENRLKFEELQTAISQGELSRRDVLRRAFALGLSAPVIAGLLAACGGGDDDEEGTPPEAEPTESAGGDATEAATEEVTEAATEEATEMATEEESDEATAAETEAATEASTEEETAETGSEGAEQTFEGGDRLMGKEIEEAASQGGVIIQGNHLAMSTLSPIMVNDDASGDFMSMVYEQLFETNPETLEPVGNLAESWSVSANGLTWTINLRPGVTWQDGEPFTADDVKFTYDLHMTEETNSPFFSDLTGKIESVEVIDEMTVAFTTNGIVADFELDIGNHMIAPRHIWEDVAPADIADDPGSTGEDPSRIVGTGPFIFREWVVEDRAVVDKNENYWDGAPHIDQFIHRYLGSETAVIQALRTGEVDFGRLSPAAVQELEGSDVTVTNIPTLSFTLYGTNLDTERTTLFQDVEVRQALLYALDREAMVEAIRFGYGEVAVGTMPVLSWAYNPDGIDESNLYPYDVDLANQLLDDAGWVMGDDGVRAKDGQQLAFTMHTNSGAQVNESYLTAFQEYWRQIGVEMTPQLEPTPSLIERITETFDFEVFMVRFGWGASPDQSPMWACDSHPLGFNIVKYCNPAVDEILAEALQTLDQERRIELYTEFQNTLLPDLPMVVFDFLEELTGIGPRLHNFFPSTLNDRFNTETWWIEQ